MHSLNISSAAGKISQFRKKTITFPPFPNGTKVAYSIPNASCVTKTVTRKNGTEVTGLWKFGKGENFQKLNRFLVREKSSKGTITHTRDYLTKEKIVTVKTPEFETTIRADLIKKDANLEAQGYSKNDLQIVKFVKKIMKIIRSGEIG